MNPQLPGLRCGIGYDTHRLVEGRKLRLGGVEVPSPRGPLGHSDGDVLCHAIADALLGAAGLGDLGHHFPDTEPRWKDASSLEFLQTIRKLLAQEGFRIVNIDTVVVLDEPRLAPHIPAMRQAIAHTLGMEASAVSVKAKTAEGTSSASLPVAAAHAIALLARL